MKKKKKKMKIHLAKVTLHNHSRVRSQTGANLGTSRLLQTGSLLLPGQHVRTLAPGTGRGHLRSLFLVSILSHNKQKS